MRYSISHNMHHWKTSKQLTFLQKKRLRRLDRKLFPSTHPYDHPLDRDEWTDYFQSSRIRTTMIQKKGKLTGAVVVEIRPRTKKLYLVWIGIHPKYAHQRLGTSLLDRSIEFAKQEGCREIILDVNVNNEIAIQWYRNRGFRETKRKRNYYCPTNKNKCKKGVNYDGLRLCMRL